MENAELSAFEAKATSEIGIQKRKLKKSPNAKSAMQKITQKVPDTRLRKANGIRNINIPKSPNSNMSQLKTLCNSVSLYSV